MKILVLGINYAPEAIGIAVYSSGLCEALAERGHEVRVVTAQPYYPDWRVPDDYRGLHWRRTQEGGVSVMRVPIYVPAAPTGKARILHHISFALSAFFPMLRDARRFRPDLVLCVAPSLISAPVARIAAWLAGARSWLHIQDFEVGAAIGTGLLPATGKITQAAKAFERNTIGGFDAISSISQEMCRRLTEMGIEPERIHQFRNWSDERIHPLTGESPYRAQWGLGDKRVALYSGNIGRKQGIEIIVEAARLLKERQDICFVICGQGPYRAELEARAEGLGNIQFHGLQPIEKLNKLLGLASVHLLPQSADAADQVLPSKLVNMLASARPVVATALPDTGLAREMQGCGLLVPPGDAQGFAAAIARLVDEQDLHARCSQTARLRAEQVWSKRHIIDRCEQWLLQERQVGTPPPTGSVRGPGN